MPTATGVKPKPRVRAGRSKTVKEEGVKKTTSTSRGSKTTTSGAPKKTTTSKKTPPKTNAARARGKAAAAPKGKPARIKKPVAIPAEERASRRELNELGFVDGTDSATIAACLVEGGADRTDVNNRITEAIEKTTGLTNRNGTQKYIPSMVSGILGRMLKTGDYEIHASWQLVPIAKPAKKVSRARK